MSRIDDIISIWSMRPAPLSEAGEAWERGARQGWQWAMEEAARVAEGMTKKPGWSPGYKGAAGKIAKAIRNHEKPILKNET